MLCMKRGRNEDLSPAEHYELALNLKDSDPQQALTHCEFALAHSTKQPALKVLRKMIQRTIKKAWEKEFDAQIKDWP